MSGFYKFMTCNMLQNSSSLLTRHECNSDYKIKSNFKAHHQFNSFNLTSIRLNLKEMKSITVFLLAATCIVAFAANVACQEVPADNANPMEKAIEKGKEIAEKFTSMGRRKRETDAEEDSESEEVSDSSESESDESKSEESNPSEKASAKGKEAADKLKAFGHKKREADSESETDESESEESKKENPMDKFKTAMGRKRRQAEDNEEDDSEEEPKKGKGKHGKGKHGPCHKGKHGKPKDQSGEEDSHDSEKIKGMFKKGKDIIEKAFSGGRKKRQAFFNKDDKKSEESEEEPEEFERKKRLVHYNIREIVDEKFVAL